MGHVRARYPATGLAPIAIQHSRGIARQENLLGWPSEKTCKGRRDAEEKLKGRRDREQKMFGVELY
jgi:hypothetical protein